MIIDFAICREFLIVSNFRFSKLTDKKLRLGFNNSFPPEKINSFMEIY